MSSKKKPRRAAKPKSQAVQANAQSPQDDPKEASAPDQQSLGPSLRLFLNPGLDPAEDLTPLWCQWLPQVSREERRRLRVHADKLLMGHMATIQATKDPSAALKQFLASGDDLWKAVFPLQPRGSVPKPIRRRFRLLLGLPTQSLPPPGLSLSELEKYLLAEPSSGANAGLPQRTPTWRLHPETEAELRYDAWVQRHPNFPEINRQGQVSKGFMAELRELLCYVSPVSGLGWLLEDMREALMAQELRSRVPVATAVGAAGAAEANYNGFTADPSWGRASFMVEEFFSLLEPRFRFVDYVVADEGEAKPGRPHHNASAEPNPCMLWEFVMNQRAMELGLMLPLIWGPRGSWTVSLAPHPGAAREAHQHRRFQQFLNNVIALGFTCRRQVHFQVLSEAGLDSGLEESAAARIGLPDMLAGLPPFAVLARDNMLPAQVVPMRRHVGVLRYSGLTQDSTAEHLRHAVMVAADLEVRLVEQASVNLTGWAFAPQERNANGSSVYQWPPPALLRLLDRALLALGSDAVWRWATVSGHRAPGVMSWPAVQLLGFAILGDYSRDNRSVRMAAAVMKDCGRIPLLMAAARAAARAGDPRCAEVLTFALKTLGGGIVLPEAPNQVYPPWAQPGASRSAKQPSSSESPASPPSSASSASSPSSASSQSSAQYVEQVRSPASDQPAQSRPSEQFAAAADSPAPQSQPQPLGHAPVDRDAYMEAGHPWWRPRFYRYANSERAEGRGWRARVIASSLWAVRRAALSYDTSGRGNDNYLDRRHFERFEEYIPGEEAANNADNAKDGEAGKHSRPGHKDSNPDVWTAPREFSETARPVVNACDRRLAELAQDIVGELVYFVSVTHAASEIAREAQGHVRWSRANTTEERAAAWNATISGARIKLKIAAEEVFLRLDLMWRLPQLWRALVRGAAAERQEQPGEQKGMGTEALRDGALHIGQVYHHLARAADVIPGAGLPVSRPEEYLPPEGMPEGVTMHPGALQDILRPYALAILLDDPAGHAKVIAGVLPFLRQGGSGLRPDEVQLLADIETRLRDPVQTFAGIPEIPPHIRRPRAEDVERLYRETVQQMDDAVRRMTPTVRGFMDHFEEIRAQAFRESVPRQMCWGGDLAEAGLASPSAAADLKKRQKNKAKKQKRKNKKQQPQSASSSQPPQEEDEQSDDDGDDDDEPEPGSRPGDAGDDFVDQVELRAEEEEKHGEHDPVVPDVADDMAEVEPGCGSSP